MLHAEEEDQHEATVSDVARARASWARVRGAVSLAHAMRKAEVALATKPWKRQNSFAEVALHPWRSRSASHQSLFGLPVPDDVQSPPPHAANCACCAPAAGEESVLLLSPRRSYSQCRRITSSGSSGSLQRPQSDRALILRRWQRPLLALRMERLTPLRIDSESEMDLPLPQCPTTARGELPNGLSYFVRSCAKPAGRAVLRLVFRVGSLAEEEDQLGLAHFVEHCAFLKLKSFGKGELISFIESTGARFGADLNAHTSWSETVYKLNVPIDGDDGDELLAKSFRVLSEWASGVLIEDEVVETERTVIEEEWRGSLGVGSRIFRQWIDAVFSHERLASRLPIGGTGSASSMKCVTSGDAQRLRDFYTANYRPELAAVVAVYCRREIRTTVFRCCSDGPSVRVARVEEATLRRAAAIRGSSISSRRLLVGGLAQPTAALRARRTTSTTRPAQSPPRRTAPLRSSPSTPSSPTPASTSGLCCLRAPGRATPRPCSTPSNATCGRRCSTFAWRSSLKTRGRTRPSQPRSVPVLDPKTSGLPWGRGADLLDVSRSGFRLALLLPVRVELRDGQLRGCVTL